MKKPIPFGKYYLLDRISVGGMAEVFKAKAFGVEGFERLIAVKRILPSIAEDEEFITMFIDEAKIAVQLQHANIAQIFDLGKVGDSFFIALEYVSGKDMRTIFDRMRKSGQTIPIPMAAYITMKVCEGLDYAHNKRDSANRDLNLVHRDVSPQNVLISYDGEIKIIDFGIAKAAGKAGKTQAGILKGKFGYMSPEQVRGLPLDRRSDIFAVGICLWEMMTGERLFVGESDFSTLEKVRNVEITPPSSYNRRIPEDLEKIVLKTLSREVEDRYQSAMDLHDDLQSWMYTSGNFFARKDLATFMQEVFREEIDEESTSNESTGDAIRSTVPPPPKASSWPGPGRMPSRPGAPPPPPRATNPPQMVKPSAPPTAMPRVSAAPVAMPRVSTPPRASASPPAGSPKRTMIGMPSMQQQAAAMPSMPPMQSQSSGAPPFHTPGMGTPSMRQVQFGGLPLDLANGKVATPALSANEQPLLPMDDWDEEEPPTNIYSKEAAAEMAAAAIARERARTGPPMSFGAMVPVSTPAMPVSAPPAPIGPMVFDTPFSRTREPKQVTIARRSRINPLVIGTSAGFVVVVTVALLLILVGGKKPGTLSLKVEPSEELSVIIDGARAMPGNESPFQITDLTPGEHRVTVKRTGYKDSKIDVKVQSGETVSRSIKLLGLACGFFLETDPPGASVWVDDRPIDEKTPVTVRDLKPGSYAVRIAKGDSFAPLKFQVDVAPGQITKLPKKTLELKTVEVTFTTEPTGATATLIYGREQKSIGLTPVTQTLETSIAYTVKFAKEGFEDVIRPIEIKTGQPKIVLDAVALTAVAKPVVATPTPRPPKQPRPPKPPKYRPAETDPGPAHESRTLPGKTGTLSVNTKPWSKVFINGEFIKNTPLVDYALRPGVYTVTVENPTYNIKKSFRVPIKSGEKQVLVKTLI